MASSAFSFTQPADTVCAASNSVGTEPSVIIEKKLKRYKITLDLPLRIFFSYQGLAPGAVSYRVRELWKGIINALLHEHDITQSLTRAVGKDSEVKEEIFHMLTTSNLESEEATRLLPVHTKRGQTAWFGD